MRWRTFVLCHVTLLASILKTTRAEAAWEGSDGLGLPEPPRDMPRLVGVEVACGKRHMRVQLQFSSAFHGIVFSKGHHGQQDCVYVQPHSGITAVHFDVFYDRCGTKPDHHGSFYENTIVVQYGVDVIEAWDEAKRLRCEWHDAYEKSALKTPSIQLADLEVQELNFQGDSVGCWMEIQEGKGPWAKQVSSIVPLGSPLTMVIAINDRDKQFDMRVKSCTAHDGLRGPIQLTDDRGCVLRPKMLTAFMKVRDYSGKASVVAFSHFYAFKFPDTIEVQIQCVVEICRHGCPEDCPANLELLQQQQQLQQEQSKQHDVENQELQQQQVQQQQLQHQLLQQQQLQQQSQQQQLQHQQLQMQQLQQQQLQQQQIMQQQMQQQHLHHIQLQLQQQQQPHVAESNQFKKLEKPPPSPPPHKDGGGEQSEQRPYVNTDPRHAPLRHTVPPNVQGITLETRPGYHFPTTPPGVHLGRPEHHQATFAAAHVHGPALHIPFQPQGPHLKPMPRRPSYESNEVALTERPPTRDVTELPRFSLPLPEQNFPHVPHVTPLTVPTPPALPQLNQPYPDSIKGHTLPPGQDTIRPVYVTPPGFQPQKSSTESEENLEHSYDVPPRVPHSVTTEATSENDFRIPPPSRPFPQFSKDYASDQVAQGADDEAEQNPHLVHSSASPVFFSYATNPARPTVAADREPETVRLGPNPSAKFSAIRPHPAVDSAYVASPSYKPPRPYYPYPIPRFGPGTTNPDFFQERLDLVDPEPEATRPSTTTTTEEPDMVPKEPIHSSISMSSGRFPSGPRSLKTKRNAAGPSDQLGVRGSLMVIAGVDLAFLPNVTRDDAMVYTGRYEEIIYGVCLPATGLAASIGVFVLLILCTSCIAAYLYYVLRTYQAKSKQSFILRRFLPLYKGRKVKH
ncbi:histone-lysine N-methyltransferase 2D-like [Ixodes scapularis]|uniref:histone-lysine N-methyltransferase 2D-like n=1 Tax=Ixodes scapularis TaxID=6945 RepID=UPI001AD7871F|nr:histone-lysine N-methyltransferase 2D-like [Ixodes scapularis]